MKNKEYKKRIKFMVMGVDSTLTDGKIYMGVNGEILKAFDVQDDYVIKTILGGVRECMIKISIIIPVYNDEEYLLDCLDSIFNQTLQDIELICINDGSTDASLEILHRYKIRKQNIYIESQENKGVSAARNRGIQLARGEYIAFMDADDYYPNIDVLESLYKTAKKEQVRICGGSYIQDRNGNIIEHFSSAENKLVFENNEKVFFSEYAFPLGFTRFIYERKMLIDNSILFPPICFYEDPLFLARVMAVCEEFYSINKKVYCHRKAVNTRKYDLNTVKDLLISYSEMLEISAEKKWINLAINTTKMIIKNYYQYICEIFFKYNREISSELYRIERCINKSFFRDYRNLLSYFSKNGIEDFACETKDEVQKLKEIILDNEDIIIYGAGKIGVFAKEILLDLYNKNIRGFAVTYQIEKEIDDLPVLSINEWMDYKEKGLFIIATIAAYQKEIKNTLMEMNFKNVYVLDYCKLYVYRKCIVA